MNLGLTEGVRFWDLEPAEEWALIQEWRRKERRRVRPIAFIQAVLATKYRDPDKHPEAYTVDDFMPHWEGEPEPEKRQEGMTTEEIGNRIAMMSRNLRESNNFNPKRRKR